MDRELLDLIADYIEARARERDFHHLGGVPVRPTADEIAEQITSR